MPEDALLDSWVTDLTTLSPAVNRSPARSEGTALLERWAEPHRSYHTGQHLAEMLAAIDSLSATTLTTRERSIARVAAWLHDAVYDVHASAGGSERESARLARKLLASLGVGPTVVDLVEQLILFTIDHGTDLTGALADVFTDADLAILAASPERFDEYCTQVRAEYAHVPDAAYGAARREILAALVDRPEVYRTTTARSEWTRTARDNVRRELDRLGSGLRQ